MKVLDDFLKSLEIEVRYMWNRFGKLTIEFRGGADKVDILREERKRFMKNEAKATYREINKEIKHG